MIVTTQGTDEPCLNCNRLHEDANLITIQIVNKKIEIPLCYACKTDLAREIENL